MNCKRYLPACLAALALVLTPGCEDDDTPKLNCERLVLDNGLTVLLCNEGTAPVVTFGVLYHVGAGREEKGKTGFAHLFEHLMFSESQHVPPKAAWRVISGLGGSMNGWTSMNRTFYYETVPTSGLESAIWMESDRMGYLLPTMTPKALATQQGVVINEKKQRYVNSPYGYEWHLKCKLLYGDDHPWGHMVIGNIADLMEARLTDVTAFHEKYYVPRNATAVLCGRFDREEAIRLIRKYFEDIPGGQALPDPEPRPVKLAESLDYFYLDKLASAPDFTMIFPAVEDFHPDSAALEALGALLSDGKNSPLYRRLVATRLAPSAGAHLNGGDLVGEFVAGARALPGVKVQQIYDAIQAAFQDFEREAPGLGDELERYKANRLREFYAGLEKSLDKAQTLAFFEEFAGGYEKLSDRVREFQALKVEDLVRVYEKYVKGRPSLRLTFLPPAARDLAMASSKEFPEVSEPVVDESHFGQPGPGYQPVSDLPSSFDRSKTPEEGPLPELKPLDFQDEQAPQAFRLMADYDSELPLVEGAILLHGGQLLETLENSGLARLTVSLLTEGPKGREAAAFDTAVRDLGADISAQAGSDCLTLKFQVLKKNFAPLMQLLTEALLEPAFREEDFQRLQHRQLEQIRQNQANPGTRAAALFDEAVYGRIPTALPLAGTAETVSALALQDVVRFYNDVLRRTPVTCAVVGPVTLEELREATAALRQSFRTGDPLPLPASVATSPDLPGTKIHSAVKGAAQTQIRIGLPAVGCKDPEYYPAVLMNYMLGGCFCARFNSILREEKAYTYGAHSYFSAGRYYGSFQVSTSVDSRYDKESLQLIDEILKAYPDSITEAELAYTKSACKKVLLRSGETYADRLQLLSTMARQDYPADYLLKRAEIIDRITLDEIRALARKYLTPDRMIQITVGPEL